MATADFAFASTRFVQRAQVLCEDPSPENIALIRDVTIQLDSLLPLPEALQPALANVQARTANNAARVIVMNDWEPGPIEPALPAHPPWGNIACDIYSVEARTRLQDTSINAQELELCDATHVAEQARDRFEQDEDERVIRLMRGHATDEILQRDEEDRRVQLQGIKSLEYRTRRLLEALHPEQLAYHDEYMRQRADEVQQESSRRRLAALAQHGF